MDPTTNNFNLFYLDIKTVSSPKTVEIIFCVRRILFSKLSIFYRVDTSRECSEYAINFVNRCYEKSFGSLKSMENKLFSKQSKKSTKFPFSLKYRKQKSHNLPLSHQSVPQTAICEQDLIEKSFRQSSAMLNRKHCVHMSKTPLGI